MLLPLICFIAHFLYFAPVPDVFHYFDIALAFAGSLAFPVYYIYFRLLTVDKKFSFRAHARFLIIPITVAVVYAIAVFLTPTIEYRTWLLDRLTYPDSSHVQFLNVMRVVLRIHALIQIIFTVSGNFLLIKKYGKKAEQFYSDIKDGELKNAKMLNYSIIVLGVASLMALIAGRQFLLPKEIIISLIWSIFSVMLYIIGYMGFKQNPINPTFDLIEEQPETTVEGEALSIAQRKILQNILILFDDNKIYLNSQLNILDIVKAVGTNRTYVSTIINQQYKQNFCSFVNSYRIEELERVLLQNPGHSNEMLAEFCGFGSVNSLKRSVFFKTGLSITEWKYETVKNVS